MRKTALAAGIAVMAVFTVTVLDTDIPAVARQETAPQPPAHAHDETPVTAPTRAVTVLLPVASSGVAGLLTIEQLNADRVRISGTVRGLEPDTRHGFHIHEFGDVSDLKEGMSVGGHFAPGETPHGRPEDPAEKRHVGDLGNITANSEGIAEIQIEDGLISLKGPNSVIGRAFVVHAKEDVFTQPTGDAGGRIAIGTIGIAKPPAPPAP